MALTARLVPKQSQSLNLTPQLRQAIELLQLPAVELEAFVLEQLATNPMLELAELDGNAPLPLTDSEPQDAAEAMQPELAFSAAQGALDTDNQTLYPEAPPSLAVADFELSVENLEAVGARTAYAYLEDLLMDLVPDAPRRAMGQELIGAMDEAGYLTEPVADIAARLSAKSDDLEAVRLLLASEAQPAGLLASGVADCLSWQLKAQGRLDPVMVRALAHLPLVAKREVAGLARVLGQREDDAQQIIAEILALDPKPGLHFAPADIGIDQAPDVFVTRLPDDSFAVELNTQMLPRVLVNERYYAVAKQGTRTPEDRDYITRAHGQASWLVRSLEQRAQTILRVATEIVRVQDQYFKTGVQGLRPLTMQKLADELSVHESTISRTVNGKLLESPRGVQPLKFFFTTAIKGAVKSEAGGETVEISAAQVRARIKSLIAGEEAGKVLSDDKIANVLKAEGFGVARRTVAKYREAMEIPPSSVRKRHKKVSG